MRTEFAVATLACVAAIAMAKLPVERARGPSQTSGASAKFERAGPRRWLTPGQAKAANAAGLLPYDTRSVLNPGKRLNYGDYVWSATSVPPGTLQVRVDPTRQLISVFRGGHEIGTAVILYGGSDKATPRGRFHILAKLRDHRSSTYDAPMPYTLRLTQDGVAIHASDVRWGYATHGCIGVPLGFAQLLFDEAKLGDLVEVVDSHPVA